MKKICLFILIFIINTLPVYALEFDSKVEVDKTTVKSGEDVRVDFYINNISDTSSGISACELKITFDDGLSMKGTVRGYGDWNVESGQNGFLFDIAESVKTDTKLFSFSVNVKKTGSFKISDITCYTGEDEDMFEDSDISRKITVETSSSSSSKPSSSSSSSKPSSSKPSSSSSSKPSSSKPSSSSSSSKPSSSSSTFDGNYFIGIKVNNEYINYQKNIYEYSVDVDNFSDLTIEPVLSNDDYEYEIDESYLSETTKKVVIKASAYDATDDYIIYLNLKSFYVNDEVFESNDSEKKDYSMIFIIIIVILVLINVIRIVMNIKKKNNNGV